MKISRTSDDAPRKLATAERASRYADQVARLPGIEMSGEQEPSHSLIDAIYHMSEEGQLRYVKWDECTKRDQELMGLKSDPVWKADASGIIRETKVKEALTAEYDTDLKLRFALQRRSLAFDQARWVDYQDFERWSQILLEAYTAPAMEGYQKVTIEQLHRADLQLFKVLIRETRNGIKAVGTRQPMAEALKEAIKAPEVRLLLQPLQGGVKRKLDHSEVDKSPALTAPSSSGKKANTETEKLRRQVENLQGQLRNMNKGKGKTGSSGSLGGKSTGKSKARMIRMPPGLIGMSPTNEEGEPHCFDFNLKGCPRADPGGRCPKGWHRCMVPGCGKPHSQKEHKWETATSSETADSFKKKFLGAPVQNLVCIELCAGSGKLSGALKSFGFTTLAIDHSRNRHNQRHPTVCVDLADDESVELVLKLSEGQGQMLFYIHAAPPFGTVRTRERRDSSKRKRRGAPEQKPLRSSKFPEGLPSLSGADLARVSTANKIFQNVCKILNAFKDVALISIENPRHSYMWDTIWLKQLISDAKLFPVDYQQCMQGGDKDKWTRFFCNHAAFSVLARNATGVTITSPGSSRNWRTLAYFTQLLNLNTLTCWVKMFQILLQVLQTIWVLSCSRITREQNAPSYLKFVQQKRVDNHAVICCRKILEFKYVATVDPAVVQSLTPGLLTPNQCQMLSCRFPAKLLPVKLGEDGAEVHQIGVFRTPNEFVNKALGLNHPFDCSSSISDDAKRAIFALFTEGPSGIKAMRNEAFDFYESLGARLEAEEQALHAGLDANRASILNGKKLLIFDRLCKDAGVEDQGLLALMLNGTRLTGEAGYTGLFSTEVTSAAMSECQLMQSSKWTRRKILGKVWKPQILRCDTSFGKMLCPKGTKAGSEDLIQKSSWSKSWSTICHFKAFWLVAIWQNPSYWWYVWKLDKCFLFFDLPIGPSWHWWCLGFGAYLAR